MTTRVTRSTSRRARSTTPLPITTSASLPVVEKLAGEILELINNPDFHCSDDLRKDLKWILSTAYDGRRMICEIQHVLYSQQLAVEWFIKHLNVLRQQHGWVDNNSVSSTSSKTASCVRGNPECLSEDDSQFTLLGFEPEKYDVLGEFFRRTGVADPTDISASSTSSQEQPRGVEVDEVTRLQNGLFAAPLIAGGIAITTTLTPTSDFGPFAVLPKVPETLIVPPKPITATPSATRSKQKKIFSVQRNKPTRRSPPVRGVATAVNPTVRTQSPRRRLAERIADARKTIWPFALPAAVLAGACLVNEMSVANDLTLRIV